MKGFNMFAALVLAAVFVGFTCHAQSNKAAHAGHAEHVMVSPDEMTWGDVPPALPAGAKITVLQGDPFKAQPYTLRLKLPANYKIPAHSHPTEENVSVISGTFIMGFGDKLDVAKGHSVPAGGFSIMPAKQNHYAWTTEETVVQVHGQGPFAITYVDAKDDPRNNTSVSSTK